MVRTKYRWVLFEIIQDPILDSSNGSVRYPRLRFDCSEIFFARVIQTSVEQSYGEFGKGQSPCLVKWFNPITKIGIIRILRDYTDMVLSSMFFINKVGNQPCRFRILHVSGTIIFIQQAAIEWDQQWFIKEKEEAEKQGTSYSFNEMMEASKRQISMIS